MRIHLFNGQQFGTLRRSSQRGSSKAGGKGGAAVMDSGLEVEEVGMSVSADTAADNHTLCRSENIQADEVVVDAAPTTDSAIQPPAQGTTSDNTDAAML